MDTAWPNVLDRIAQLGVYDEYSGGEGKGKERGPNHVRARKCPSVNQVVHAN